MTKQCSCFLLPSHTSNHSYTVSIDLQNARSVREDTAELATYLLSDPHSQRDSSFLRSRASIHDVGWSGGGDGSSVNEPAHPSGTIVEVSEPPSPSEPGEDEDVPHGPSVLSNLLRKSPPHSLARHHNYVPTLDDDDTESDSDDDETEVGQRRRSSHLVEATEETPLIRRVSSGHRHSHGGDVEGQKSHRERRPWLSNLVEVGHKVEKRVTHGVAVVVDPRRWDRQAIWSNAIVAPASCLPAVAVGLLLNILDALSYGTFLVGTCCSKANHFQA